MESVVLYTETLPPPIREKIHTQKVFMHERNGGIILLPLNEGSGLRGVASESKLTTEKLRAYKDEDTRIEK
ncbi:hypothetical protein FACS1894187_25860 [Synergistales bacterium]|nr:hypothetical protein FACS1894187_25860 [Synergistales bacterium]